MDGTDLREVQSATTRMTLHSDPGFLNRIKKPLFTKKTLLICEDKKTLELAKQVIKTIKSSTDRLIIRYGARDSKDLSSAKIFYIRI